MVIAAFRFMVPFIRKEQTAFLIGVMTTLCVAGFTWLGPQLLAKMIDGGMIRSMLFAFALSEFAKLMLVYLNQRLFATFGQNVIEHVRSAMINHLIRVPVSYFDRTTSGQIMTRFVNDANSLTDFFQSGMISIVGNILAIIAVFLGIHHLNTRLAWIMFLVFIPFVYACSVFSVRLQNAFEQSRNELSNFNSMLADFLHGMKTIRSLALGASKNRALSRQIGIYSDSQVRMVHEFALFNPVLSLGIGVLFLVLIVFGIPMVDSKDLKTGEWIAILSYVFMLQQPLFEVTERWNFFLAGITSIGRIRTVFDEPVEKSGKQQAGPVEALTLNGVCFRYPTGAEEILKGVNLKIQAGDRIGFYGESGMGKTTLLQLLFGYYQPTGGEILWNGIRYASFSMESIRSHFGVVEQFPFLFSGTIRDNITLFGKLEHDYESMKVHFRDYPLIHSLLERDRQEIRERGANLSMGERQLISFLRAFLKKPDIWVLDEATAFFDDQAEREFMRALDSLTGNPIILQIAHRKDALKTMQRQIQVSQKGLQE